MNYYFYQDTDENLALIDLIYYVEPDLALKESRNYIVKNKEDVNFEDKEGFAKRLYFNKETKEIECKYEEIPPSEEQLREARILDLELAIAELMHM